MADARGPSGRIVGPIETHAEPRAVWVLVDGRRYVGREEATAQGGRARLCRWSQDGLGQYGWVGADAVEDRPADDSGLA